MKDKGKHEGDTQTYATRAPKGMQVNISTKQTYLNTHRLTSHDIIKKP